MIHLLSNSDYLIKWHHYVVITTWANYFDAFSLVVTCCHLWSLVVTHGHLPSGHSWSLTKWSFMVTYQVVTHGHLPSGHSWSLTKWSFMVTYQVVIHGHLPSGHSWSLTKWSFILLDTITVYTMLRIRR